MLKSRRWAGVLALLLVCLFASAAQASDGVRIGIVVSNQAYTDPALPQLNQPHADALRIEDALRAMQFDIVEPARDATPAQLRDALDRAKAKVKGRPVDLVFFYYSGHGGTFEARGDNYLFGVNFDGQAADAPARRATRLSDLLATFNSWNPSAIVMAIDACRTLSARRPAPMGTSLVAADPGESGIKGGFRSQPLLGAPVFISFATAIGESAPDQPYYSEALSRAMVVRGADVPSIFEQVSRAVAERSDQTPHFENGLRAGTAWLQPRFPVDLSASATARLEAPAGFVAPRFYPAPEGGGLWVMSGLTEGQAAIITVDRSGRRGRRIDLEKPLVIDRAFHRPEGGWIIGGHADDITQAGFLRALTPGGALGPTLSLDRIANAGAVRQIAIDGSGAIWAATDGRMVSLVRANASLTQAQLFGVLGPAGDVANIRVNHLAALGELQMAERDCLLRPRPCAPFVWAAGSFAPAFEPQGLLAAFLPRGSQAGQPVIETGSSIEFVFVGADDCCRLAGTVVTQNTARFLFAKANELGFVDAAGMTRFLPPDETSCQSHAAVELTVELMMVVGNCGTAHTVGYAILVSKSLEILGVTRVCGEFAFCEVTGVTRNAQGEAVVIVKNGNPQSVGFQGDGAAVTLRSTPAKGVAPTAG